MALDDHAVHRADVVRKHDQRVAHGNLVQRHIENFRALFPMGDRRHPLGQRRQHRRGALQRVVLERLSAREHQHDDRAGQIFAEQHGGDDGDAGQQIGTKLPLQKFAQQFINKRNATESQRSPKRNLKGTRARAEAKAKDKMKGDRGDGKSRNDCCLAPPEIGQ